MSTTNEKGEAVPDVTFGWECSTRLTIAGGVNNYRVRLMPSSAVKFRPRELWVTSMNGAHGLLVTHYGASPVFAEDDHPVLYTLRDGPLIPGRYGLCDFGLVSPACPFVLELSNTSTTPLAALLNLFGDIVH